MKNIKRFFLVLLAVFCFTNNAFAMENNSPISLDWPCVDRDMFKYINCYYFNYEINKVFLSIGYRDRSNNYGNLSLILSKEMWIKIKNDEKRLRRILSRYILVRDYCDCDLQGNSVYLEN